jgi:hypothetical protein
LAHPRADDAAGSLLALLRVDVVVPRSVVITSRGRVAADACIVFFGTQLRHTLAKSPPFSRGRHERIE